jgi:hypothetical protein
MSTRGGGPVIAVLLATLLAAPPDAGPKVEVVISHEAKPRDHVPRLADPTRLKIRVFNRMTERVAVEFPYERTFAFRLADLEGHPARPSPRDFPGGPDEVIGHSWRVLKPWESFTRYSSPRRYYEALPPDRYRARVIHRVWQAGPPVALKSGGVYEVESNEIILDVPAPAKVVAK